jgi:hypothetical protein
MKKACWYLEMPPITFASIIPCAKTDKLLTDITGHDDPSWVGWHRRNEAKGKGVLLHGHKGAWGERRYSSYSFSTSALDGGE